MKPSITLMKNDEEVETRLSIKEACEFLGTDRQNIYNAIRHGWKCNGFTLFDESRPINAMLEKATYEQLSQISEYLDDLIN